ncbi:hypothetical protein RND71_043533 [Anisodus tanguticus]|uniref:phosphoglucomutase (alpha-D-glucose-1,6-bisphosphate-dependent) n=1 Tax=Anisodus tanguticus TaxID=243964 RepID=A0AAE1QRH0_9SOLA|nr:hypothetical protein RND71_043533 [Anisodus tanguticus]
MVYKIQQVETTSYSDQKPGTSGLRKQVKYLTSKINYVENFIQSIYNAIDDKSVIVCGGDGRFYSDAVIDKVVKISAANGIEKLIIGKNGILSTPAVSSIIREKKASGGIILTASHNPGGPDGDFGIKFNGKNGGPATEIFEESKSIKSYSICKDLEVKIDQIESKTFEIENNKKFTVEIIDSIETYLNLMKEIFDFNKIKTFLSKGDFNILIDSLNGVMGPYTEKVFVDEFGLDKKCLRNYKPLPDFGGLHPDPNLTYAKGLLDEMKTGVYDFGAAFDGDGDRNMILGKDGFFVTPSDSLAVIGANLKLIPYFKKTGVHGFARSMPTAPAIDQVAKKLGLKCFEVPTGWKFFGNLMDEKLISLCGEESFGTGSDHIREKDGLWTVLCWLSILAEKGTNDRASVSEIVNEHWKIYGRNFFTRYDYENCETKGCDLLMEHLNNYVQNKSLENKLFPTNITDLSQCYVVEKVDNFEYLDCGIRIIFKDGSRIILRLSGTGSTNATLRLYIDRYTKNEFLYTEETSKVLETLVKIALDLAKVETFTGMKEPTVIT